MIVDNEDKELYHYLKIMKSIMGKDERNNHIISDGLRLDFDTQSYFGSLQLKTDGDDELSPYNFGHSIYDLKELPNKDFSLERYEPTSEGSDFSSVLVENDYYLKMSYKGEINKDMEFVSALICNMTGIWIKDADVKLIRAIGDSSIVRANDKEISFTHIDDNYTIMIGMRNLATGPDDTVQQLTIEQVIPADDSDMKETDLDEIECEQDISDDVKIYEMDEDLNITKELEDEPEEFEDEYDPMAE